MAKRTTVVLIDDTDHSSTASQTIPFSLDGVNYEIDLNDENAARLRDSFAYWIEHARRSNVRRRRAAATPRLNTGENQKIRNWAKAKGKQVADRGRIPAELVAEYRQDMASDNN